MRNTSLDVLRAVAMLVVLAHHVPESAVSEPLWLHSFFRFWGFCGWAGVDLFFVLSGFLVSGLIFREYEETGNVRVGRFLLRRGIRIYPPFYTLVAVSTFTLWYVKQLHPKLIVFEALFIQNYAGGSQWHTWSLAVEEHFYLLLAFFSFAALKIAPKRAFRWFPALFAVTAIAAFLSRLHLALHAPYSHRTAVYPTHLRIDGLFFGSLLAYFRYFHPDAFRAFARRHRWPLFVVGLAAISPIFHWPLSSPLIRTLGLTLNYLGFGAILTSVSQGGLSLPTRGSVFLRPLALSLATIGRHSYSIYLWHIFVGSLVMVSLQHRLLGKFPGGVWVTLYYSLSLIVGITLSKLVEQPSLRLREELIPFTVTPNYFGCRPRPN